MAVPKRSELANRQRGKIISDVPRETSERSLFLAMDYDYKNGCLAPHKHDKYMELKKQYENL